MKKFFRTHPLTNYDIDDITKELNIKNFKGSYMRQEIPKLKNNGSIIINLDDNDGPGTHWTACINKNNKLYYYDSYGLSYPDELLKITNKPIIYNPHQNQHMDTVLCGWYCIYFINEMSKGTSYDNILNHFDIGKQGNRNKIFSYFNQFFKQ